MEHVESRRIEIQRCRQVLVAVGAMPVRICRQVAASPLAKRFAELCEPGFVESIVDWRAMTPEVYEREFNLPEGHATSFAGGPDIDYRAIDNLTVTGTSGSNVFDILLNAGSDLDFFLRDAADTFAGFNLPGQTVDGVTEVIVNLP